MSRPLVRRSASAAAAAGVPRALAATLGSRGGIVKGLMNINPDPEDPELFLSLAIPGNPKGFVPGQEGLIDFFASGMGRTPEEANTSAVAEAVERYCSAYVQPDRTVLASWKELGTDALHPNDIPLFTAEQHADPSFPYRPFTEDSRIRWFEAHSLTRGRNVYVPAALTWDSYQPMTSEEEAVCFGLMTGSAAGSTIEQAMLGGLLEIIERDSFMIMWYNRLQMPGIDLTGSAVCEPFRALLDERRFRLDLVDTTSDIGVPSVFGLLRTSDGKVSFGGAARCTLEEAVSKTLMEISQLYMGNKAQIYASGVPTLYADEIIDYGMRLPYYEQPEAIRELEFTCAAPKTRTLSPASNGDKTSHAEQLQQVIARLEARGLEVICADVTTEDARALGLHVVKMIVPGTVQLPRSERERLIGSRRIFEVPVLSGYRTSAIRPNDLNAAPHPFP
ncbi:YcaO-like family protein [Saccharibacillus kuerlensis]|uniref:YcaO domain-containing protein n=1 Tax=Saccharibacillus kuerlensis TaxID=459527 RepID=A0ABQ2L1X7_9BACL|nr:YcaO-like family protein [Saccharibacillus kuerlensis]GGN99989.1 hypothetical protein GCM10010969_20690 [Saccharibacillus kuerlensis]